MLYRFYCLVTRWMVTMSFLKKTVLVAGLTAAWLPVVNAAGIREAVEKTGYSEKAVDSAL